MNESTRRCLDILKDADASLADQQKAATHFLNLASKHEDIAEAVPMLINLYRECHQLPVMEPAAEAIVLHLHHAGDIKAIENFIANDTYKTFSMGAITRIAERGTDITPLIPVLLKFSHVERYPAYNAILAHLKQPGSTFSAKLAAIATQIASEKGALEFLPFMVQEGAIDHLDMGAAMPALAELLEHENKHLVERVATAMTWAVEGKTDFSGIVKALEQAIKKPGDVQGTIAYCLSYHLAKKKRFDEVERLARSASTKIRMGACRAIAVQLNNDGRKEPRILAMAIEGLLDTDVTIREQALGGLLNASRKQVRIVPDPAWIGGLAGRLVAAGNNKQLFDFLYAIASKDASISRAILDAIKDARFEPGTTGALLKAVLAEQLEGKHAPVCSICSQIPRDSAWNRGPCMSNDTSKLNLEEPSLGSHASLHACPECGAYYWYEYEQVYDDMSLDTTTSLRRLDLDETMERLSGIARATFEKQLPALLDKYKADLDHPVDFARGEAAWMLARHAIKRKDWPALVALLKRDDEIVVATILFELVREQQPALPVDDIGDLLKKCLAASSLWIRHDAATLVARQLVSRKDYPALIPLLKHDDPHVLNGVTGVIWLAVRNEHFDLDPLIPALIPLTRADDRSVRNNTLHALKEASLKPGKIKQLAPGARRGLSTIDVLVSNMSDARADVRNDAARTLGYMITEGAEGVDGADMAAAIPAIIKLIENPATTYNAISALKLAVNRKMDISPAMHVLVDCLKDPRNAYHDSITELLVGAQRAGVDISAAYDILGKIMPNNRGNLKPMAVQIFEQACKNNEDVALIEPYLEKAIGKGENDSYGESFIKIYTYINIKNARWEKVIKLLEHPNKHVPGSVASYLAEHVMDFEPLVPALVKSLLHGYWYVRSEAADALKKYMGLGKHARDVVRANLKNVDPRNAKDTKDLDAVIAAACATPEPPAPERPPAKSPEQEALEQMLAKKAYLVNLERVVAFRGNDEARYIFCEGDLLFDAWFDPATREITKISWTSKEDLEGIIRRGFAPGTIQAYLKPYAGIPKEVLDGSAALAGIALGIIDKLSDPSKWYFLKPHYKTETKRYLYHHETRGFMIISSKAEDVVSGLVPCSRHDAESEIRDVERRFPGLDVEAASKPLLAAASTTWEAAEKAMQRLESGEICAEMDEKYYRRYYIHNNGNFFYIFADGGTVDTVSQRSRDVVFKAMLELLCKPAAIVPFVVIDEGMKNDILVNADPDRYLDYIKKGDFSIGGGPTTDMQWSVRCENGQFIRSQGDGHGGVETSVLTEDDVKALLENRRYGWARTIRKHV